MPAHPTARWFAVAAVAVIAGVTLLACSTSQPVTETSIDEPTGVTLVNGDPTDARLTFGFDALACSTVSLTDVDPSDTRVIVTVGFEVPGDCDNQRAPRDVVAELDNAVGVRELVVNGVDLTDVLRAQAPEGWSATVGLAPAPPDTTTSTTTGPPGDPTPISGDPTAGGLINPNGTVTGAGNTVELLGVLANTCLPVLKVEETPTTVTINLTTNAPAGDPCYSQPAERPDVFVSLAAPADGRQITLNGQAR